MKNKYPFVFIKLKKPGTLSDQREVPKRKAIVVEEEKDDID